MKSILIILATIGTAGAAVHFDLPGTHQTDHWTGLTSANYGAAQGYPIHPTATQPWPSSIASDSPGSSVLEKVSGGGYFASSSLYDAGSGGMFRIADSAAPAGLATVIFQADTGTGIGIAPVLHYNGGSQGLVPDFAAVVAGAHSTFDFQSGQSFPSSNHLWQWDLSGIGDTIASYEIVWGSRDHEHLTQYALAVTTGDSFAQVVPEPSVLVLAGLAPLLAFVRRR